MTAITDMVDLETREGVAVVCVDNPPVNALSAGVRTGLYEAVTKADADGAIKAILIICKGRTYIAGADIREFGMPPKGQPLPEVQAAIEGASKPVISAIHGTALGGGLETALCCHFRVAVASAQFGLPEVKLGLLPGAGGTQRLPRVVGVQKALEMMTSGDPVGADFALACGLIDEIVNDLMEDGLAFAKKVVEEGRPPLKVRNSNEKIEAAKKDPELFAKFRSISASSLRYSVGISNICGSGFGIACAAPVPEVRIIASNSSNVIDLTCGRLPRNDKSTPRGSSAIVKPP